MFPHEPFCTWTTSRSTRNAGIGVGSALIEHGLAFAWRDGTPASRDGPAGQRLDDERRGFRTYLDEDAPNGGPYIWFMRFDPEGYLGPRGCRRTG